MPPIRFLAAPLLVAGCAGGPPPTTTPPAGHRADADWSRAQPVEIVLREFAFEPARIELAASRPYLLRLRNDGTGGHNFVAPAFFQAAATRDDPPPGGGVEVARGEVKEIAVVPLRPGEYPVECTHLLHALFGMTAQIAVR